jgi:uncharacterized protein YjaG (DUF416 family)
MRWMTYYRDLSDYRYFSEFAHPGTKNIGWLAAGHEFERAEPADHVLDRLWRFCKISVAQSRGIHECEFSSNEDSCKAEHHGERRLLGTSEIRVFSSEGEIYAAPTLIYHYVSVHKYSPPDEFIRALIEGPAPPDQVYFERLEDLQLEWNETSVVTDELYYNEYEAVRALAALTEKSRIAFSAACAERLLPSYQEFCQSSSRDDRVLPAILESIWNHLLGDELEAEQIRTTLTRCMALAPRQGNEPWRPEHSRADDAVSAATHTLLTIECGEAKEATWASRRAYEAVCHHVMHRLGIEDREQVLNHPVVQAELVRQRRDIDDLRQATQISNNLIIQLRDRARADASIFFTSVSQTHTEPTS